MGVPACKASTTDPDHLEYYWAEPAVIIRESQGRSGDLYVRSVKPDLDRISNLNL
jgi:hypothetical protein